MASIAQATIDISANIATLRADLARGSAEVNKFQRRVESGFRSTRNLLAGLGIGLGVSQIVSFGRAVIDTAGQINDMAEQLSLGTDELQALNFAAREAGIGAEAMQAGIIRLNESIGEAVGGNKTMRQSFDDLGVAFADANGNARDNEAVLADLARAYDDAADKTKFTADLTDVMGRTAGRLVPILDDLGDGWTKFNAEAEELGQVIGPDVLDRLDQLGDWFDQLRFRIIANSAALLDWAGQLAGIIQLSEIDELNKQLRTLTEERDQLFDAITSGAVNAQGAAGQEMMRRSEEINQMIADLIEQRRQLGEAGPAAVTPGGGGDSTGAGAATREKKVALDEMLESMREEHRLLQLTDQERAVEEALLKAADAARTDYANKLRETPDLLASERAQIILNADANFSLEESIKRATEAERERQREVAERAREAARDAAEATREATAEQERLNAAGAEYGRILGGIATGTMTWRDLALAAIDDVTAALIDLLNTSASGGSGGLFGSLFGLVGGLFSGGGPVPGQIGTIPGIMGDGGPVTAGAPYIVGDRGPELFVPGRSGAIVPNGEFGGGSTFVIDARGADRQGLARLEGMIRALDGSIERRSVAATLNRSRRGVGGIEALA